MSCAVGSAFKLNVKSIDKAVQICSNFRICFSAHSFSAQCQKRKLREGEPADDTSPVALWAFCRPDKVGLLDNYLTQRVKVEGGLKNRGAPTPTRAQLEDCQDRICRYDGGKNAITLVEQRPGDKVVVPPGWPHAVINLASCVKVAWDSMRQDELCQYVHSWKSIVSPFFKAAPNHVCLDAVLVNGL